MRSDYLRSVSRLSGQVLAYFYLVRLPASLSGAAFVFWLAKHNGSASLRASAYAAAATFCTIGAGFALNDATDAREDLTNNPSRPIPKGSLHARSAFFAYATLAISALMFGILVKSSVTFSIVLLMLVAVSLYSSVIKRILFLKNVFVASIIATVPVIASSCASVPAARTNKLLVAALFLWSLEKEILMDVRDIEGDRRVGLVTLPIFLGRIQIGILIAIINLAFWSLALLSPISKGFFLEFEWQACFAIAHTVLVAYLGAKGSALRVKIYLRSQVAILAIVAIVLASVVLLRRA